MPQRGTASIRGPYLEFQKAVLTALPRDINDELALKWARNGAVLAKVLREVLVPPEAESHEEELINAPVPITERRTFALGSAPVLWDPSKDRYTITELLRAIPGLTKENIYYWERKGYIHPETEYQGRKKRRIFSQEEAKIVARIYALVYIARLSLPTAALDVGRISPIG